MDTLTQIKYMSKSTWESTLVNTVILKTIVMHVFDNLTL